MLNAEEIFRNLLPHLWLRPERALWDAIELSAVSKILLPNLKSPSMEYGCTDGLNTFVMLGGRLSFEYDDYSDIPDVQTDDGGELNFDYFESPPKDILPKIICTPIAKFDLGLSWKISHLTRAARLGVYKKLNLMQFDKADSENFGKFSTIWAPQLFWTSNEFMLEKLVDLESMLNPGGSLITILPTENQKLMDLNAKLKFPPATEKIIDKGISHNFSKNARSPKEWGRMFDKANFEIVEQIGFMNPIVSRFYHFGFRPMFGPLLKMHSILMKDNQNSFLKLKKNWVDTLHRFIDPLISENNSQSSRDETLWMAYRLKRKSKV